MPPWERMGSGRLDLRRLTRAGWHVKQAMAFVTTGVPNAPDSLPFDHASSASPAMHDGVSETKREPGAVGSAQSRGGETRPLQGGVSHHPRPGESRP